MKQEETAALLPKLRFPEFQNTGEWKVSSIGDLKPFVTSGSRGWAPFYADKGELFVRITNLWRDSIYLDLTDSKFVQLPSGASEGVRTQLKEHDVLISITADIGIIGYVDESVPSPAYINQHIALVRFDKEQLCGKYVAYFLASEKSQRLFRASTDTGTKAGMSLIGIQKIKLTLPGLPEQQHIAEFLTSVDKLIATQARKVDVLKTHKKGLMQQLFPREGETHPRLRFPEFQNAAEWEEYSLGQLIEIASGQVDPKQPPYCDSPQIGSENIESHSGKLVNVKSAGEKGVISGNYAFDETDILYSKIRPALNKVAAPSFKGICSADIYPIRPAAGNLLRGYLFYLLLAQDFLDHAIRNSERGKIPKINRDALDCYKALIPLPAEQQLIASCLSSLDALITAETQKHETLKSHKNGLMQQLFPAPGRDEL